MRPTLVRGEGVHVWDAEGRRYLDAASGTFCVQLGYGRADLVRAMSEAASRLPFARASAFDSEESEAYASELLRAVGSPFTRVIFTTSGSEAVEAALKAAWFYRSAKGASGTPSPTSGSAGSERTAVTRLQGHFHGSTIEALRVTSWQARRAPYERLLGAGNPAIDPAHEGSLLASLRNSFALIAETIPVAGLGAAMPAPGSLARIRRACDEADALWIADEVPTGFGRVGSLFAWQRLTERNADTGETPDLGAVPDAGSVLDAGAMPDIICFGKGAGCGYAPLGGILLRDRVATVLAGGQPSGATFLHAQTYGGHAVSCAVGRRVLAALGEEKIHERVRANESRLREALEPLASHPHVSDVRGLGFLWGIELREDPGKDVPFPRSLRVAERVEAACRDRGLLVFPGTGSAAGQDGDHILVAPPLVSEPHHFAQIAIGVREALDEVTRDTR